MAPSLLVVLVALGAPPPLGAHPDYFVGEWTDALVRTTKLSVQPDGTFEVVRWQPALTMDVDSRFCSIKGRVEAVNGGVVWRASPEMERDFRRRVALRRGGTASPEALREADEAVWRWCSPLWGYIEHGRRLAAYEFAPWGDGLSPRLYFVERDQFAGLFGPWPHAQVFRRDGAPRPPRAERARWMLWVERDGVLGASGALTVTKNRRFTLTWIDGCIERGSVSPRRARGPIRMTTSTATCGPPLVRELVVSRGTAGFHPAVASDVTVVHSGDAIMHLVPVR